MLGGIGMFFIARLFEVGVPLTLGRAIDSIVAGHASLWPYVLVMFGFVAMRFIFVSWARIAVRRTGFLIAYDLRDSLFAHLQKMGPEFYSRYYIGDLMTRATADIQLIRRLFSHGTTMAVIFLFASIIGFSAMAFLSPLLTLLILPPMPFLVIYTWRASLKMGIASRRVQASLGELGAHVQENLAGIRTIQAMAQEDNELKRFNRYNQSYVDNFYSHSKINSAMTAVMPMFAAVALVTILGYGGTQVLEGSMSLGSFVTFFFLVNMVVQPFRAAGMIVSMIQRAAVACRRLYEIYHYDPEIQDLPGAGIPEVIRGDLAIHDLRYRYSGSERAVLDGISLTIRRGETVAVMGAIGCGKTTLLQLIARMIDTPQESIYLDGNDVCRYPLHQLRTQVALVPQDTFLFGEPLRSNITYDHPPRRIEAIWRAADAADLTETIEEMPMRMETIVGERGITLSGGQKQRTALARGLIRQAPVLLLDDCFSSIDTETEESILNELSSFRHRLTTILVSHRVSTARHADRIIVLNDGRILEQGTHTDLLQRQGRYAEFERIQREGNTNAAKPQKDVAEVETTVLSNR